MLTVPDSHTIAPLKLVYKPDAAEAQNRMRAYWAGSVVDRSCISIRTPKDGISRRWRSLVTAPDFDFARDLTDFQEWADGTFFGGESMPAYMPNWGPDQWAGFLGADMTLAPEMDTSWVIPMVDDWDRFPELAIDPKNKWWSSIVELTAAAAAQCDGKFILSTIDTHSNLDCISALRGPAELCMDLIDCPDKVLRAIKQVDALYKPVYDAIYEAGRMGEFGTSSWSDVYSEARTGTVQCDFAYMVSPEHFRRFILPSLEHEISLLDHSIYHMDGVGQLPHLDELLGIPGLHTVQWVPGAGQPTAPAWIDMLRKVQKAGKSVQVFVTPDELKAVYKELAPAQVYYWVTDCKSESEARELLRWMEVHT